MTTIGFVLVALVVWGRAQAAGDQVVKSRDGACEVSVPNAWKVTPLLATAASPDNKVSITVTSPKMIDSFAELKVNAKSVNKQNKSTRDTAADFEMEGLSIAGKPDVYRAIPAASGKYCIAEVIYENGAVDAARAIVRTLKPASRENPIHGRPMKQPLFREEKLKGSSDSVSRTLTRTCRPSLGRAAFVMLLGLTPALGAQASPETKHGTLTLWPAGMGIGELPLPAPQAKAATAGEDWLMALFKRNHALGDPIGFKAVMHRSDGRTIAAKALGLPFNYGITTSVTPLGLSDDGRTIEANQTGFDFVVLVNGTGLGADINEPLGADGGPSLIRGYRKTGMFRGSAVYDGQCVFITRNGQQALFPASRGRYLREKIAQARRDSARHVDEQKSDGTTAMSDYYKQYLRDKPKREADMMTVYNQLKKSDAAGADKYLAEMRKAEAENEKQIKAMNGGASMDAQVSKARASANAQVGEAIQKLQDQLDAMPAAERNRQAYIVDLGVGQTRLANDDDSESETTPLVQINPAAYNKALGLDVPQVVSVCLPGLQSDFQHNDQHWDARRGKMMAAVRDGFDWAALEGLVKR
jgi:hypothetical protein